MQKDENLADGRKLTLFVMLQKKICMVELFSNVIRKVMIEELLDECMREIWDRR
jgi:hypothetical protein